MPRPLTTPGLLKASRRRYLEEAIGEVRRLKDEARDSESWSAVERFQRQERELFGELQTLRDEERGPSKLDPEAALNQVILPALAAWPRPLLERLFKATALRLGIRLDALGEDVPAQVADEKKKAAG